MKCFFEEKCIRKKKNEKSTNAIESSFNPQKLRLNCPKSDNTIKPYQNCQCEYFNVEFEEKNNKE